MKQHTAPTDQQSQHHRRKPAAFISADQQPLGFARELRFKHAASLGEHVTRNILVCFLRTAVDYSFACSDQDVTNSQALVGCFLGEFTAGSQALLTLTFIPVAAQNLSVSGQLVFDNANTNADGNAANNIAESCMNIVGACLAWRQRALHEGSFLVQTS